LLPSSGAARALAGTSRGLWHGCWMEY
jgi:hypothetical protein